MTSRAVSLLLAALLVLAGCDDAGADHQPPPGEDGTAVEIEPEPRPTETEVPAPSSTGVPPLHPDVDDFPEARVELATAAGEVSLDVKVADTPGHRRQGLMHVEHLPDGTGMLFVFDGETDGGFWMKNTVVPLDIAFVDADGEIVAVLSMDPCEADPCEVYEPGVSYTHALEVAQGWFEKAGVDVGDELAWSLAGD